MIHSFLLFIFIITGLWNIKIGIESAAVNTGYVFEVFLWSGGLC